MGEALGFVAFGVFVAVLVGAILSSGVRAYRYGGAPPVPLAVWDVARGRPGIVCLLLSDHLVRFTVLMVPGLAALGAGAAWVVYQLAQPGALGTRLLVAIPGLFAVLVGGAACGPALIALRRVRLIRHLLAHGLEAIGLVHEIRPSLPSVRGHGYDSVGYEFSDRDGRAHRGVAVGVHGSVQWRMKIVEGLEVPVRYLEADARQSWIDYCRMPAEVYSNEDGRRRAAGLAASLASAVRARPRSARRGRV